MANDLNIRVLNKKQLTGAVANAVYVGRPSIWGNPFVIGTDGTRAAVIAKYEAWIVRQPDLMARLHELRGKNLVCWCHSRLQWLGTVADRASVRQSQPARSQALRRLWHGRLVGHADPELAAYCSGL